MNKQLKQQLRTKLRQTRNSLSQAEQEQAAEQLALQIKTLVKTGNQVALYLANDGEISVTNSIEQLNQADITTLLPVMHSFRKGYLNFQRYQTGKKLIENRFGIPEPKLSSVDTVALEDIDIIFMPLVGFDAQGNRLGMGGGFYDRTLSRLDTLSTKPLLVGLAHDCQQVDSLVTEAWDIPLDIILTPKQKILITN